MGVFRFFHSSSCCRSISKSGLAYLRKKTGFPFANIRKALELHNNDTSKAEEWLKEQAKEMGWAAAEKLQNRQAAQGLVGVAVFNKKVAMVEVNCETDFVSRNNTFKSLVELVTSACLTYPVLKSGMETNEILLNQKELQKLQINGNETLADCLALSVGSLGENLVLKRAYCFETTRDDIEVAIGVHPASDSKILMGKYGSFVSFQRNVKDSLSEKISSEKIGKDLCKHIIGMNPVKIGDLDKDEPAEDPEDENILIYQELLSDNTVTVGQFLLESGTKVLNFKRFECGESQRNEVSEVDSEKVNLVNN